MAAHDTNCSDKSIGLTFWGPPYHTTQILQLAEKRTVFHLGNTQRFPSAKNSSHRPTTRSGQRRQGRRPTFRPSSPKKFVEVSSSEKELLSMGTEDSNSWVAVNPVRDPEGESGRGSLSL